MDIHLEFLLFKDWAKTLGVFPLNYPRDEVLTGTLKYRHGEIIKSIRRRVKSSGDSKRLHLNISLHRSKDPMSCICTLPAASISVKEIQMYINSKTLKKTEDLKCRQVCDLRCKKTFLFVKTRNIYKLKLKRKIAGTEMKAIIYQVKAYSLEKILKQEEEKQNRIALLKPFKILFEKPCEDVLAVKALQLAKKNLKSFFHMNRIAFMEFSVIIDLKSSIWWNLRDTFKQLPNWRLWKVTIKAVEQLSWAILQFTNSKNQEKKKLIDKFSLFELKFIEIRSMILNLVSKFSGEKRKGSSLNQHFFSVHAKLMNVLQVQLTQTYGNDECVKSIISEYLEKINLLEFCTNKADYLNHEINLRKHCFHNSKQKLEAHHLLINKARIFYNEVNAHIHEIKKIKLALEQTEQKTIYTKKSLYYMLNATLSSSKFFTRSTGLDSFEISDILCSTKLDIETSFGSITHRPDTNIPLVKSVQSVEQFEELHIFQNWLTSELYCLNKISFWHVKSETFDSLTESLRKFQLFLSYHPDILKVLLRMESILKRENKINLFTLQSPNLIFHSDRSMKPRMNPAPHLYKIFRVTSDEIKRAANITTQKLRTLYLLCIFILENILCKFIPLNNFINKRRFTDYYEEFETYSQMF